MSSVTGIVLAAGSSERMGRPKMLLPYGTGTVLDSTISSMTASAVHGTIVVTGAGAEAVEQSIDGHDITVVRNADHQRGNMSSLLTATGSVGEPDAFVLVPGDLPEVATAAIDQLVDAWAAERPWAAVTEYNDRIGHPMLLSRSAIDAAAAMTGRKVLWRLLIESGEPSVRRLVFDSNAPLDVNTPEGYRELVARHERAHD